MTRNSNNKERDLKVNTETDEKNMVVITKTDKIKNIEIKN